MNTKMINIDGWPTLVSDDYIEPGDFYIDRKGKVQQCENVRDNILLGPNQAVKAKGEKGWDAFSSQPKDYFGCSEFRVERKIIASENPKYNLLFNRLN